MEVSEKQKKKIQQRIKEKIENPVIHTYEYVDFDELKDEKWEYVKYIVSLRETSGCQLLSKLSDATKKLFLTKANPVLAST